MYLVKFLLYGVLLSLLCGEFGRFPFGASGAISLTDITLSLMILFFLIWNVQTKKIHNIVRTLPLLLKVLFLFQGVAIMSLLVSLLTFTPLQVLNGALYLLRFFLYTNVLFVIWTLKKEKILQNESLENMLLKVGLIVTAFGYIQLLVVPDFNFLTDYGYDPHIGRLSSTFLDPNFTALFLVLTLSILIKKMNVQKRQISLIAFGIVLLGAIVLTFSRSGYLMLFIFLGLLSILKFRKLILVLAVTVILASVFSPRFYQRIQGAFLVDKSASERIVSWQNAITLFKNNPLTGVGFNTYRYAQERENLLKVYSVDGGHSGSGVDSSFLFVGATTGIIGLLLYLFFWYLTLKKLFSSEVIYFSVLVALLVSSQFVNALFYGPILIYYLCIVGGNWDEKGEVGNKGN